MSTYREIVGKKIKKVSSDPSAGTDGQMWYNTATQSLRGLALTSAWSSASQLGTGRYLTGGFGSQTAGVATMGAIPPGASPQTITEHYDGTRERKKHPARTYCHVLHDAISIVPLFQTIYF